MLLLSELSFAQTISGVINSYLHVTSINLASMQFTANGLSGNISDFQPGKTILIYQAKGATISTSNNANHGAITAYNNAGNYELAVVSSITGAVPYIITVSFLENKYTSSGSVQLVSVPQYDNVTVNGNVTAVAWDPSLGRGGIVALEVANTLTLNADINVVGQGFQGGSTSSTNGDCPDGTTFTSTNSGYAAKGEGITTNGSLYARGARANAGGGGNPHNAGGGGGSNFTYGGNGGQGYQLEGCTNQDAGGLAGKKIDYNSLTNKVFFGGGGGGGQQNNNLASAGARGGGIIIVRAATVVSSCSGTYGFLADGQSAVNSGGNDGAGGGGGGGSIILDVQHYTTSCNILVRADGGNGGMVSTSAAHGGGGGGGIGIVMETNPTSDPNVILVSSPGTNGMDCNAGCITPSGTLSETPSSSSMEIASIAGTASVLPIALQSFNGKALEEAVLLTWTTNSEIYNDYFTLERSQYGHEFMPFATIPGAGNSHQVLHYAAEDKNFFSGFTYYRLKQTDFDGRSEHSQVIYVATYSRVGQAYCYPNPTSHTLNIMNPPAGIFEIFIRNSYGIVVSRQVIMHAQQVDISHLDEGIYVVEIVFSKKIQYQKLIINR